MMHCQRCGEENTEYATFCKKCRMSLEVIEPPRKITFGFTVTWLFGIIFGIGGFFFLMIGEFGAGIALIIASLTIMLITTR